MLGGVFKSNLISTFNGTHISNLLRRIVTMGDYKHSETIACLYDTLKIVIMPALQDNFMYLFFDIESKEAAVVDPVNPSRVIQHVDAEQVHLTTILTTHHHYDHAGGNADLVAKMRGTNLTVIGGEDRVNAVSKIVSDGDVLKVGSLNIRCIHTPCHTMGHMCYYVTGPKVEFPVVFTGDTLFIAGCGRFFEGTADMMNTALNQKLASLPNNTRVFCGHEYTLTNLKFALTVEPENRDISRKLEAAIKSRKLLKPTVPSFIGDEKKTNPFMRVHETPVQSYANVQDVIETMAYIRKKKDSFKA